MRTGYCESSSRRAWRRMQVMANSTGLNENVLSSSSSGLFFQVRTTDRGERRVSKSHQAEVVSCLRCVARGR